jgi:hypothetical protein
VSIRVTISDIAEIRTGYLTRKGVKPEAQGSHWLLQIRDFNGDRTAISTATLLRFSPVSLSSSKPLQPGDVVFLARGSRNFAYAVRDLPSPTLAAGYFFVLNPCAQAHPDYLAWYLNQESVLRTISRSATSGAHMPVVRRADLESLEIPLPPISVQNAIVDLDNLRREEHNLLCTSEYKKNALISAVCLAAAQSGKTTGERE